VVELISEQTISRHIFSSRLGGSTNLSLSALHPRERV